MSFYDYHEVVQFLQHWMHFEEFFDALSLFVCTNSCFICVGISLMLRDDPKNALLMKLYNRSRQNNIPTNFLHSSKMMKVCRSYVVHHIPWYICATLDVSSIFLLSCIIRIIMQVEKNVKDFC